jgi:hypothetical protein
MENQPLPDKCCEKCKSYEGSGTNWVYGSCKRDGSCRIKLDKCDSFDARPIP